MHRLTKSLLVNGWPLVIIDISVLVGGITTWSMCSEHIRTLLCACPNCVCVWNLVVAIPSKNLGLHTYIHLICAPAITISELTRDKHDVLSWVPSIITVHSIASDDLYHIIPSCSMWSLD